MKKQKRSFSWIWILSLLILLFSGYRWLYRIKSQPVAPFTELSQASSQRPAMIPSKGPAVMTKMNHVVVADPNDESNVSEEMHPLDAFLQRENAKIPLHQWKFDRRNRNLSITGGLFSSERIGENGAERLISDLCGVLGVNPDNQFHISNLQKEKSVLKEATVYTLQQFFQGYPVYNTVIHVSWSETARAFFAISSNMVDIQQVDNNATMPQSEASQLVKEAYKAYKDATIAPYVYDKNRSQPVPWVVIRNDRARLYWIFKVAFKIPYEERRLVFVDASTGETSWVTTSTAD